MSCRTRACASTSCCRARRRQTSGRSPASGRAPAERDRDAATAMVERPRGLDQGEFATIRRCRNRRLECLRSRTAGDCCRISPAPNPPLAMASAPKRPKLPDGRSVEVRTCSIAWISVISGDWRCVATLTHLNGGVRHERYSTAQRDSDRSLGALGADLNFRSSASPLRMSIAPSASTVAWAAA